MPTDFSSKQIRVSQLIASGGTAGSTAGLLIYSASTASDLEGTFPNIMISDVGPDVFVFISGSQGSKLRKGHPGNGDTGVTLFGGDVVVSGTLYAERQVIEVDEVTTGSLMVSGTLDVSQSIRIEQGLTVNNDLGNKSVNDIIHFASTSGKEVFGSFASRDQFLILSGGGLSSPNEFNYTDMAFFVSGTVGSKDSATIKGVALFGGDIATSGSIFITGDSTAIKFGQGKDVTFTHDGGTGMDIVSAGAFDITAGGASTWSVSSGQLTIDAAANTLKLDGHTGVDIDASNSGKVAIDGAGGIDIGVGVSNVPIDINAGTLAIDTSDNTNLTIGGSGKTLDIDASGALTLDSDTSISIGTNADKPIDIDSTTLDIAASDIVTVLSTAGITLTGAVTGITGSAGAFNAVNIKASHSAGGVDIDAGTSGVSIDSTGGVSIDAVGTSNITTNGTLTVSGSTGLNIASDGGEIDITARIGNIDVNATSGNITIDATGVAGINSGGTLSLGTANSGVAVNIGHGTSEVTVGDNLTVTGDVTIAEYIKHAGDTDTLIRFQDDDINVQAGGVDFIKITEDDSQDLIEFNVGEVDVNFIVNNTNDEALRIDATGVVFNEDGHSTNDFRVESNTNTHMFFIDSWRENVGINVADPRMALSVVGAVSASLGYSGSLTRLVNGKSFIEAGANITVVSASNGAITISGVAVAPGGSDTQVQFNNAGSFGGITNLTTDSTNVTLLDAGELRIGTGGDLVLSSSSDNVFIGQATNNKDIIFTAIKSNTDYEVMRIDGSEKSVAIGVNNNSVSKLKVHVTNGDNVDGIEIVNEDAGQRAIDIDSEGQALYADCKQGIQVVVTASNGWGGIFSRNQAAADVAEPLVKIRDQDGDQQALRVIAESLNPAAFAIGVGNAGGVKSTISGSGQMGLGIGTNPYAATLHVRSHVEGAGIEVEQAGGGDVVARIYDIADDGIIDVYANNVITSRMNGNGISFVGGDFQVTGANLDVAQYINHLGDLDTRLEYATDTITLRAGGTDLFKVSKTENTISINPDITSGINTIIQGGSKLGIAVDGNADRVLVLSGGAATSPDEGAGPDISFYVSGSLSGRHGTNRGVSVFGGDTIISGSLRARELKFTTHLADPNDADPRYVRFNAKGSDLFPGVGDDNKMVTAYIGSLIKVIVRSTVAAGNTVIGLHTNTDGQLDVNSTATEAITVNIALANTAYTYNFTKVANWGPGDIVCLSFDPSQDPGSIMLTAVWEFESYN